MSSPRVPSGLYWKTRLVSATQGFWRTLGGLESAILREDFAERSIDRPIYICGLARAGSTILTEIINAHPDVTSHRYSDFPFTFTPYWTNWLQQRSRFHQPVAQERAHRDRIQVTPDSPEAVEEVIWMHFFDQLHTGQSTEILDQTTDHPLFEQFYKDHIQKLLMVRQAQRYLAKGNYNISRIRYLLKLFPDARFVLPVRHPYDHIASLRKQHRLFSAASDDRSKIARQLAASGHFEFGPQRRPIHLGDSHAYQRIHDAWQAGNEVEGWALLWSAAYRHLLELMQDTQISAQCRWVRYEDLCDQPESEIKGTLGDCELPLDSAQPLIQHYSAQISRPDYYKKDFTSSDLEAIQQCCASVAAELQYSI